MLNRSVKQALWAVFFFGFTLSSAQTNPFDSWRALIVFTNTMPYVWGTTNPYRDFFITVFDGMNQSYEASGLSTRTQIAGVVWDKTYDPSHQWGCQSQNDLATGSNGMDRYVALLDKYAADVIILVHEFATPGGCAEFLSSAVNRGYGAFWTRLPADVLVWIHEIGHIHDLSHCHDHRVTLDATGEERAGPIPYDISNIVGIDPTTWHGYMIQDTVLTDYATAYRGFHGTMAYSDGGSGFSSECARPGHSLIHTYGGVTRRFLFAHHGQPGPVGWTGTFSSSAIQWYDEATSTYYPTGYNEVKYVNRLKYHAESVDSFRDTTSYFRNSVEIVDTAAVTLSQLKGIPTHLTLHEDASVGVTVMDSQWIYSHFVATNSISIRPGFKVLGDASMRLTVGASSGSLAKRGKQKFETESRLTREIPSRGKFQVKYDRLENSLIFELIGIDTQIATISVFSMDGKHVLAERFTSPKDRPFSGRISVSSLPNGVYLIRATTGGKRYERKWAKW